MVLLTMTENMVEALEKLQSRRPVTSPEDSSDDTNKDSEHQSTTQEQTQPGQGASNNETHIDGQKQPSLKNPGVGRPILHGQVVDIWMQMKNEGSDTYRLESLLKGSRIYVSPPPAKKEPTSEYKALMARLRREEEERTYERMTNPPPPAETFAQRFPLASAAHAFPSSYQNIQTSDAEDDGTTYADIDRQMTLIFNVLISVVACAAGIWITARWWSTPMRLALSMSGSLLVGVAEVVVYAGYIRRVGEAKTQEKKVKEVKEIVNTWVVGAGEKDIEEEKSIFLDAKDDEDVELRRRKKVALS